MNYFIDLRSRLIIKNILQNFKTTLAGRPYQVVMNETMYSDAGAIAIMISRNDEPVNMYLFYPDAYGTGNIGSIAIYGTHLTEFKQDIENSHMVFGLPVQSVIWDCGVEEFLDVTLQSY